MTAISSFSKPVQHVGYAKAILFGEHSVVHGYKAVVCSVGPGARVSVESKKSGSLQGRKCVEANFCFNGIDDAFSIREGDSSSIAKAYEALFSVLNVSPLSLKIDLDIPTGAGLGSSAAIGVASARAILKYHALSDTLIGPAVEAFEKVFHSNPSGVDQAAATHRGLFSFDRKEGLKRIRNRDLHLVIAKVSARAPTHEIVEAFAAQKEKDPCFVHHILDEMGKVAVQGIAAIKTGKDAEIGRLMSENHALLRRMKMSSDALDHGCDLAIEKGAHGAKLTGAGRGGCMLALVEEDNNAVEDALKSAGYWTKRTLIRSSEENENGS